ncbi:hypothetical protein DL98DRAFT_582214 [Cadophora sp. DSE1049]|nr:hypothetical protein DL98DRAFT_582214 [Cadophora sp. DSE1049]
MAIGFGIISTMIGAGCLLIAYLTLRAMKEEMRNFGQQSLERRIDYPWPQYHLHEHTVVSGSQDDRQIHLRNRKIY